MNGEPIQQQTLATEGVPVKPSMARDFEVIHQVVSQHGLTVTQLAFRTGLSEQTIYKYLAGKRTIPTVVFRAAYELTGDGRLPLLITGSVPVEISFRGQRSDADGGNGAAGSAPRQTLRVPPIEQTLPRTLEAARQVVECGQYLAKVFEDGTVDRNDLASIAKFERLCADARTQLALCHAAIESARERIEQCK